MAEMNGRRESVKLNCDDEIISDETFETMLDALEGKADDAAVSELLQVMNENRIISREEADQILEIEGPNKVVKCGLPQHVRPSDPENTTDAEMCISRLLKNDPTLTEINLNNMKRTPIPLIQRMILAIRDNTHLKKLLLANTALTDAGAEPFIEVLENNTTLETVNLETNFLSGDFLAKLFKAALKNQSVREIKAVNQSPTFSTEAEMEIMHAVNTNKGLTKVSVNLRHPEAKNKVEQACLRNGELRRQQRRFEQLEQTRKDAEPPPKPAEDGVKKPATEAAKPAAVKAPKNFEVKPIEKPPPKKEPVRKTSEKTITAPKKDDKKPPPAQKKEDEKKEEKKAPPPEEKKVTPVKKEEPKPEKNVPPKKVPEEKPAEKKEPQKKDTVAPPPPPPAAPAAPAAPADDKKPSEQPAQKAPAAKPNLSLVAKDAAAKALNRGFGTSANEPAPKPRKISISDRTRQPSIDESKVSLEPMVSPSKPTAARPGSLSLASKDVATSKGLGAATFGAAKPTSSTASALAKTTDSKGRRGSASATKPPVTTPKAETPTAAKTWGASLKPASKMSDMKSKFETGDTKSKPVSYGYGSGKKRDSIK